MTQSAQELILNFLLPDYIVRDLDNYTGIYDSFWKEFNWTDFKQKRYRLFERPARIKYLKSKSNPSIDYSWYDQNKITYNIKKFLDGSSKEGFFDEEGRSTHTIITDTDDDTITHLYWEDGIIYRSEIHLPDGTILNVSLEDEDDHMDGMIDEMDRRDWMDYILED
jgi:hypothetical protein